MFSPKNPLLISLIFVSVPPTEFFFTGTCPWGYPLKSTL